jgi:type IV secretory pathway VirB2 component (pilin)
MKLSMHRLVLATFLLLASSPLPAFASVGGGTMPWDAPLTAFVNGLSNGTVRTILVLAAIVAGIVYMWTDHSRGWQFISKVIAGGCVALFATSFLSTLGIGGACL